MKKTQQILSLPVIEISSGNQLGKVSGIGVNPDQGSVECLLINGESWYSEMRVIPFAAIQGVGQSAVTIMNLSDVFPVSKRPDLVSVLEKNVVIINAGVMSRTGTMVGKVSEYMIDNQSGLIRGCEIVSEDGRNFIIPGEKVLTYGSKYLVIEDGYEDYVVKELSDVGFEVASMTKKSPLRTEKEESPLKNEDPVQVFETRQRQYLAGKKATKKIVGVGGQVIVEQGATITEEVIEQALALDKYIELTMNIED